MYLQALLKRFKIIRFKKWSQVATFSYSKVQIVNFIGGETWLD
jgi:hypothetical protein